MVRALFVLLAVALAGMVAVGLIFSMVIPLAALAIKILFVLLVGYLILRLIRPDLADDVKSRLRGS